MVKNSIKMLLCALILLTTGILAYPSINNEGNIQKYTQDSACNYLRITPIDDSLLNINEYIIIQHKKDSLRNLMIREVQDFIDNKAPKAHSDIAALLVDNGLNEDIDIAFMMAQAHLETNFGTAGAGKPSSRHSLFGVNGKFKNYSDAIVKYTQLLKKNYLTHGRTEQDLMSRYTTSRGSRYCPNPSYEATLRNYYKGVTLVSNIRDIQKQYNALTT